MKAEIMGIGTELLMGELTDTNSSWIASRLPALGIELQWVSITGDDLPKLTEAFKRGMERSDIIFTTGGLGPTQDDLTREAIASALEETPVIQQEVVDDLERYFAARGTSMPQHNIKQANLIPSAKWIINKNGTAPGWWTERDGKIIICMPGPPGENRAMWEEQVEPELANLIEDEVTITRNIKTMGMSEGAVDEVISEFFGIENPYLGIYSKADGIHLRVIARAKDGVSALAMIQPVERAIHERLGPYIWGYDDETPEQSVGKSLTERGLTLAVMEMCTGGALTNAITNVPNSISYFKGGIIAHEDTTLSATGVPKAEMERYGVVSQHTANTMADTVRRNLNADLGVAVTGVPGPGEFEGKPLGLAYISVTNGHQTRELEMRLPPRQVTIKRRVPNQALIELRRLIEETS
ncbi:MAG: CinA family nicotinamide mononucleotide deamidase-related protein [Chloroflexota bacterium]|nr:CinA family nicotinamide mononucleotide deamidase-related protein [Dehalococcoidia bacterium]MEE3013789.1 CinA family nicotinamide mononucleotide deamidase-related protein [Chloroflexota bacterium]GIS95044.1 MAG: putative competence-damage inducible protein [Dehalococcoidia bacterium]